MSVVQRFGWSLASLLLFIPLAQAGTVHGTVTNATTGKVAAGVEVILIQLQGTMQPVANTKTDGQGAFSFDNPNLGKSPMLVRAVYHGVNFHQPVPPGRDTIAVSVYETTSDPKAVEITSHIVIFQPSGGTLTVGEEYSVQNKVTPPQSYFSAAGNFEFALPEGAELKQIAASGPSGMPVVQAPIEKGKGKYAIAYAFHPGESDVRVAYDLPYKNDAATVRLPATIGGGRLLVVAPPSVTVTGDGLSPAGQEQGMSIYQRSVVTPGTTVAVNLSGTAPPVADNSANGGSDGSQGDGQASSAALQVVPGRLDSLKWPLIGGFVCLFALAAFLLSRKQVAVAGPGPALEGPSRAEKPGAASSPMAAIDTAAAQSLDALKDQIFRLELRRQAGTISEDEYAQERAKAEQVLRDLVRG